MTAKEKLYKKTVELVERLVSEGKSLTASRLEASSKMGLCYPTVFRITKHLSAGAKETKTTAQ